MNSQEVKAWAILSDTKEEVIEAFRDSKEPGIAVVVKKLELGFDTACDWIMFMRENMEESGFCQKVGRAKRTHKPTFEYEQIDDFERALELFPLAALKEEGIRQLEDLEILELLGGDEEASFTEDEKIAYILKPRSMKVPYKMMDAKALSTGQQTKDSEKSPLPELKKIIRENHGSVRFYKMTDEVSNQMRFSESWSGGNKFFIDILQRKDGVYLIKK